MKTAFLECTGKQIQRLSGTSNRIVLVNHSYDRLLRNNKIMDGSRFIISILPFLVVLLSKSNGLQSGKGVCILDVPSTQLISEEDRGRPGLNVKSTSPTPGYSKIEVCCTGYKLECVQQRCVPECETGCENGQCTGPNICTCNHGYIKGPKDQCIRVCPWGCLNGICSQDGRCSCNSGYTLHINAMYCIPSCYGGCGQGGECINPNQCKCSTGYRLDQQGKCVSQSQYQPPQYPQNPVNQYPYNQPNQQQQQNQYPYNQPNQHQQQNQYPQPDQHQQQNQYPQPDQHQQQNQYTSSQSKPLCNPSCANGQCTGPNQCSCNSGYNNDPMRPHLCVAHCPGGCPNGVCTSPNFCICNAGFVKKGRGSNECVPSYG